jgi:hypothetical protein
MNERFTLRIPDSWQSYDLSGEELAVRRAALLTDIDDPDQRAAVNRAFREVRVLLDDARRRGAVYAAGTLARHEDGLLMANLAVFVLHPPRRRPVGLEDLARDVAHGNAGTRHGRPGPFGGRCEPDGRRRRDGRDRRTRRRPDRKEPSCHKRGPSAEPSSPPASPRSPCSGPRLSCRALGS